MNENLHNIQIAVKNINGLILKSASKPAHIVFDKGNQKQGITHKVFIYHSNHATSELFRAKTLKGIVDMLAGFDAGLWQFPLFKQR